MANNRFVFYRYPSEQKAIFRETEQGVDNFHFSKFEEDGNIVLKGESISYSKSFEFELEEVRVKEIPIIDFEKYKDAFTKYQECFRREDCSKAILSRVIEKALPKVNLHDIFNRLCEQYPSALIYVASLGDHGVWAGASPERLLLYKDGLAKTVALAGTKRTNDPDDWGQKEKDEHRAVELYIEDLDSDQFHLNHKSPVYLKKAGNVYHQKSDFTFSISENHILDFLDKLHPTPAVCGVPQMESRALIKSAEQHKRSFYTGYLGLVPGNKTKGSRSFELYVNLRCMQIVGNKAFIYVGGGITKDSILESEWQETEDKAKTMLGVLS